MRTFTNENLEVCDTLNDLIAVAQQTEGVALTVLCVLGMCTHPDKVVEQLNNLKLFKHEFKGYGVRQVISIKLIEDINRNKLYPEDTPRFMTLRLDPGESNFPNSTYNRGEIDFEIATVIEGTYTIADAIVNVRYRHRRR